MVVAGRGGKQRMPRMKSNEGLNPSDAKRPAVPSIGSKSQVQGVSLGKKAQGIDVSDVDLEIEDEHKNFFVEENFKNNEWYIGTCPF